MPRIPASNGITGVACVRIKDRKKTEERSEVQIVMDALMKLQKAGRAALDLFTVAASCLAALDRR